MFGVYGILLELYTPRWGGGGTIAVISPVLSLFALTVLPTYVGLALLLIRARAAGR